MEIRGRFGMKFDFKVPENIKYKQYFSITFNILKKLKKQQIKLKPLGIIIGFMETDLCE